MTIPDGFAEQLNALISGVNGYRCDQYYQPLFERIQGGMNQRRSGLREAICTTRKGGLSYPSQW